MQLRNRVLSFKQLFCEQGVVDRDQIVFEAAKAKKIPIVMVLSGGYQRSNASIIADSILSLKRKNLIEEVPLK